MTTKMKTKPRMVDANDLVGVAEISQRLSEMFNRNIQRSNVTTWIYRRETQSNGFPKEVIQLAMGGVFLWSEVLAWYEAGTGRAA